MSLVDVLPTLVDLGSDGDPPDLRGEPDGRDDVPVLGELLGEGAISPHLMIRRGRYKFIHGPPDPDQLFDLSGDPDETANLAEDPAHAETRDAFRAEVAKHWDVAGLHKDVLASQRRRRFVQGTLMEGKHAAWDFQPFDDASRRYMRNHMRLNDVERQARFPRPDDPADERS